MTGPVKESQERNKERDAKDHSYLDSASTNDMSVPVPHIALS